MQCHQPLLRASALFLALLTLGACSDRTSLLVRVTSDLAVPGEIDALEIDVRGGSTGATVERDVALHGGWPQTLSVRPGEMESGEVTITVTATRGGAFVVRRVIGSAFVPGVERVVDVELGGACRDVRCDEGVDCVAGRCETPTRDGGPDDAGRSDAGMRDAATCGSDGDCDDSVGCTIDRCTDGACENVPDDTTCAVGATCDPVEGCPPRACDGDDACDDDRACNGMERCVDGECALGTAVDCDDADACTDDVCDEAMRGECVHRTRDADGDRAGDATCAMIGEVPADDCDDTNPEVFPGAPEICNGIDDDCEGGCDESFTCCRGETGSCDTTCGTTGTRVCTATCGWSVCSPPAETCNAVDDDCNGGVDDVFACVRGASQPCTTACGSTGERTCGDDCTWSACVAPDDVCNGRDDDCDASTDESFECVSGTTTACTTTCGTAGSRACDASCALGACTPPAEGCNGIDDDCDGDTDETVECSVGAMEACTTSCGSTGSRACSASCTWSACTPPTETCNGNDDDCDGRIDETFTCVPGATGTCSTGCSTTGTRVCSASCTWGACTPPVEACNGADDNCDTRCDETFACCAGSAGTCTTSCGTTGSRTCSAACGWSTCSPPAEACNGVDDDCNGACDDGFTCCAGRTGACTTSCGSTGSRTCAGDCSWGSCAAPPEACGGGDDDCDTRVDEGFACSPGATGPCTTSCGTAGTRSCGADCAWGTCTPPAEACNGVDDNCNGLTDEGCGACVGCTGAIAVSGAGGRYDVMLSSSSHSGTCGGTGAEGVLTFTLSSASDVFITTHGSAVDTVLYVRNCYCNGAERACNDDADGRTSSALRLTNLPAGTYQVFVDTRSAASGTIPVDVYITPPGTQSDRCGNPSAILPGATTLSGDTCAFTADYVNASVTDCDYTGTGASRERVYYFVVPGTTSRTVSFSGCTGGTSFDSTLYVRSVCSDASVTAQRMCNDDGCSGSGCSGGLRSSISATLAPGLYYLFVDGYQSGSSDCPCGAYSLSISGL
ncbi:Hypothetical protein I5071_83940 [Sandaracinus amylolyticus]|nr:Hypothetical protein I5071_83940 [Sandaracinus amylolyticus]